MPTPTSTPNTTRKLCRRHDSLEDSLKRIERCTREGFADVSSTLKTILQDLREGAVEIATIRTRLTLVERLVFGAVGIALTGLIAGVLALVLKGGA